MKLIKPLLLLSIILLGGCVNHLGGQWKVEYKYCNGEKDVLECYSSDQPEIINNQISCGGLKAYNVCTINKSTLISK